MTASSDLLDRPTVRMKPKTNARAIRHGFPWVYANELVTDRRTKSVPPGTLAVLEDEARAPLGLVAVNPLSKIICRMIDTDPAAVIDEDWFAARIARALALRETLHDAPFYRLVHAEADGLPGVVIDRFGETCVIQPNAAWAEARLPDLAAALARVTGVRNILKNAAGRARGLEGLDDVSGLVLGQSPEAPVPVLMNGATYMADLTGGQKTGLFFDQRPNHAFAAGLSRGARVLDVFSHVGGFALAALANGAASALAVDGSAPALSLAAEGARQGGMADRFATRQGDAFDVLTALGEEGAQFEVVICDPPAFAPSKQALEAGLRAYERIARLAAPLVAPGGYLGLCSCSHAADLARFRTASVRGIGRAGRSAQLLHTGFAGADHPMLPQLAELGVSEGAVLPAVKAVLDTCVLFPTVMREMLLGAAALGHFTPLWSTRILGEWARAARKLGPTGTLQAEAEIALLRAAWPRAEQPPAPGVELRLYLPDPADRHVLAVAVAASADLIITLNARDFPRATLAEEGLDRRDPDAFLHGIWLGDPDGMGRLGQSVLATANRLDGGGWTLRPLLKKARLPRLAKALDPSG